MFIKIIVLVNKKNLFKDKQLFIIYRVVANVGSLQNNEDTRR